MIYFYILNDVENTYKGSDLNYDHPASKNTDNFNKNKHSGVAILIIEKPFGRTWNDGILYEIIKYEFPKHLVSMMKSYLRSRKFYVTIETYTSEIKFAPTGVPRGNILHHFCLLYI